MDSVSGDNWISDSKNTFSSVILDDKTYLMKNIFLVWVWSIN